MIQEINRCKQDTQARNKRDIIYSQQISVKYLRVYTLVAVTGEIGHDRKPSMLYGVPIYSSVMPHDRFLMMEGSSFNNEYTQVGK
jgi:hypothetical protein